MSNYETFALTSNYATVTIESQNCCKIGNVCYVSAQIKVTGATADRKYLTIPNGYRPKVGRQCDISYFNNGSANYMYCGYFTFEESGKITQEITVTSAINTTFVFSGKYICE